MTSTASDSPLTPVKFSRLPKRGLLLGLTAAQLAALGAGLVPLILALYLRGTAIVAALPLAVLGAVVALLPVAGRPVVDWLPIVCAWAWRTATGQLEFRARLDRPRPAGTLALPGRTAALRLVIDPSTGAALVHDPHAATLSVTVPVTSTGFTLLDDADQARRVTGWGRVLATICRSGQIAALTITERTLPGSGASLTDWWQANGTGDSGLPAKVYSELIERAGPTAERHETTVTLALDLRTAARAVRAAGGGMSGAAVVLRQETQTLVTALRAADLTPSAPLDPAGLAVRVRTAYDPTAGPLLEHNPYAGQDLATAGPLAVTESWGAVHADASWHAVLWIAQWPQSSTYPGFLAPVLLTSGIQRTLSIRYQPVRPDAAARDLRRKKTGHITEAAQRAKVGQIEDATQAAELDDVLAQEADLAAGHGVLRATGFLTITAGSAEELEHDVAAVEQAGVQAGCETRRLWGQQAVALGAVAAP
ncbi:SCO6880 family protein [Myceligenerans xiligouense]|uniref:Putative type VII ESX secretion system EccE translocon n=1 Tax=Myceligenerans xiligouense TaxID=253184 RepID=A0A3N4Z6J9_9MICO|nr:SCO6880 family protein [Myceligenerans xiligouense]RPF21448.1 putative type VII ESX secretion system EccE translocon [Myceligenerans xiligouense]